MSSKSGGSGSGGWLPDAKPSWWGTVAEFAQAPTVFIQKRIATYIVGAFITVVELTTGKVRWVWSIFADAIAAGGDSLTYAFGLSGDVLLDALGVFPGLVTNLVSGLGPITGPVIAGGALILVGLALWEGLERTPGVLWKLYQLIPGT